MSKALNLACRACEEYQWIGQADYIYRADKHIDALEKFLFKHQSHFIEFVDDQDFAVPYYTEFLEID